MNNAVIVNLISERCKELQRENYYCYLRFLVLDLMNSSNLVTGSSNFTGDIYCKWIVIINYQLWNCNLYVFVLWFKLTSLVVFYNGHSNRSTDTVKFQENETIIVGEDGITSAPNKIKLWNYSLPANLNSLPKIFAKWTLRMNVTCYSFLALYYNEEKFLMLLDNPCILWDK